MAKWYRNGGCILRFNDTVTIYQKIINTTEVGGISTETESWTRTVVKGVQWADKYQRENVGGKISVARYASITFPEGTYEGITLEPNREEDAIVYGEVSDTVNGTKGHRISDLLENHIRSGRIQSVNDNTNRDSLKNIKVVVG